MKKPSPDMQPIQDREVIDLDAFEAWLAQRGWAWQGLERGDYGLSLNDAKVMYVWQDPVLWARAYLTEPDTGEPYQFWPYQEEGARAYDQDGLWCCGAEVGKTRQIIVTILWGQCTGFGFAIPNPSILVAAPMQSHLDEIIMSIEAQVGAGRGSEGRKPAIARFWREPKKSPHYTMFFKSPTCTKNELGVVYFRPAGHDGEAFRGVHVSALGLFDEFAKVKNKVIYSEFIRALKPGCKQHLLSVPDGDNSSDFYRLDQQAIPNLPKGKPGMRSFRWAKTLMPAPFWSEERDKEFQRRYGGRDAPGYQRNVLGLHGQQENPVWPWLLLESNIRDVPEYRVLKLSVDEASGQMRVQAQAVEIEYNHGKKAATDRWLADRDDDLTPLKDPATRRAAVMELLREFVEPVIGDALLWAGADLGFSNDPTEIILSREVGEELRDIVRISAKGMSYDVQCELVYCLDKLTGFRASWGCDFGGVGTVVVQMLQSLEIYADGNYVDRLTGFNFASVVDCIDEAGNLLEEEDGKGDLKSVRLPAKELATNLMTARFQRRGYAQPYDQEVLGHLSNHTAREGARHRIFSKVNDHTLDAKRVQILRKAFNEQIGVADVFSSGVHVRRVA